MKNLIVKLSEKNYPIYIENGLLNSIGSILKEFYNGKKIAIITDKTVDSFYGEQIKTNLEKNDFIVHKILVESGEKSKSVSTLLEVYNKLISFGITRSDLIIAFGGGVVGDLGGFAASTLLRGIPFIQIPTTLLAQVDSSIGGKVAIDLPQGKNLVGSFYHPKAVFIDPLLLRTLDKRFLYDGMAEVIKYGCIKDKDLFFKLTGIQYEEDLFLNIHEIIFNCCNIKREIVEKDENDTSDRMILNFGHTLGHAIEKYYNFEKYTHGEAVAIGMYSIAKISEAYGIAEPSTSEQIKNILIKFNLPYSTPNINKEMFLDAISLDKKSSGENINIIFIKNIGDCIIKKISKQEFFNLSHDYPL